MRPSARCRRRGRTVCAYVPSGSSRVGRDARRAVARCGARVLLPGRPHRRRRHAAAAAVGRVPARRARRGAVRPARAAPSRGCPPAAVADGDRGVRARAGRRPRAVCGWAAAPASTTARCRWRDPAARLVAVVRDDELVDELPAEPHDVRDDARADPGTGTRRARLRSAARQHVLPSPASRSWTPTARRRP